MYVVILVGEESKKMGVVGIAPWCNSNDSEMTLCMLLTIMKLSTLTVNNRIDHERQWHVDSLSLSLEVTSRSTSRFPELSGFPQSYRPHLPNWFLQQSQILSNNLSCKMKNQCPF